MVTAYFQPIENNKERHEKRLKTRRKIYNLNKMEDSDWQAFAQYSSKYYKDHNYKRYESLSDSRLNLNLLWTKLKEILITTANKTVPISYRSSDEIIPKPKALTSCYTLLKKLNVILLAFRTKFLTCKLLPDTTLWTAQRVTI